MHSRKVLFSQVARFSGLLALFFFAVFPAHAKAVPPPHERGEILLRHFAKEFTPEKMVMILDEDPMEDGYIREMFMDIAGCRIGGVRIAELRLRAMGVTLNSPGEWEKKGVGLKEMLHIHAFARITDKDLNENLLEKKFGDDDAWRNLQVSISPDGIYARGNYLVTFLFNFDILIEIFSKFRIEKMQQIWLDDYTLRVNRVDVPEMITERAVAQIQPLLDLGKFIFPLKLHSINYENGSLTISSRVLPVPLQGVEYHYYEREQTVPLQKPGKP